LTTSALSTSAKSTPSGIHEQGFAANFLFEPVIDAPRMVSTVVSLVTGKNFGCHCAEVNYLVIEERTLIFILIQ
jgi:hypothetical protein